MSDVTRLLERWNSGDRTAMAELLAAVYDELRQAADRMMRTERDGHTLQPTALVNELYLRFAGLRDLRLENRRHFYGAAGQAMRRSPRLSDADVSDEGFGFLTCREITAAGVPVLADLADLLRR